MSKTILIADDNKNLGKLLQDWLKIIFPDYAIATVLSGVDAIGFVAKEKPDLVIMDIHMPGINGIEATRQLKNEHPSTKVIILSVFDDDVHRCASLSAGASGYIAKSKIRIDLIPLLNRLIMSEICESRPAIP